MKLGQGLHDYDDALISFLNGTGEGPSLIRRLAETVAAGRMLDGAQLDELNERLGRTPVTARLVDGGEGGPRSNCARLGRPRSGARRVVCIPPPPSAGDGSGAARSAAATSSTRRGARTSAGAQLSAGTGRASVRTEHAFRNDPGGTITSPSAPPIVLRRSASTRLSFARSRSSRRTAASTSPSGTTSRSRRRRTRAPGDGALVLRRREREVVPLGEVLAAVRLLDLERAKDGLVEALRRRTIGGADGDMVEHPRIIAKRVHGARGRVRGRRTGPCTSAASGSASSRGSSGRTPRTA